VPSGKDKAAGSCSRAEVIRPAIKSVAVTSSLWSWSDLNPFSTKGKKSPGVAFADDFEEDGGGLAPELELAKIGNSGPQKFAILGTRETGLKDMKQIGFHAKGVLAEGHEIFTSGGVGTNQAVIKAAIESKKARKVTVILPQSLSMQDEQSMQPLLKDFRKKGGQVVETADCDGMTLQKSAVLCNRKILEKVDQVVIWATSKSEKYLQMVKEAEDRKVLVNAYYIDPPEDKMV